VSAAVRYVALWGMNLSQRGAGIPTYCPKTFDCHTCIFSAHWVGRSRNSVSPLRKPKSPCSATYPNHGPDPGAGCCPAGMRCSGLAEKVDGVQPTD